MSNNYANWRICVDAGISGYRGPFVRISGSHRTSIPVAKSLAAAAGVKGTAGQTGWTSIASIWVRSCHRKEQQLVFI